jgi:proteasome lid subunit RPN8/RPN11
VVIPAAVRDEIVAHARAGLPNEACGILAGVDGRVERFFPAEPDEPSPYYYRIESRDQIRIMNEIDEAGLLDSAPWVRANCAAALRRLGDTRHYASSSSSSVTSMSRMR